MNPVTSREQCGFKGHLLHRAHDTKYFLQDGSGQSEMTICLTNIDGCCVYGLLVACLATVELSDKRSI